MLKWILAIVAAVVLLGLGFCWYGYRELTSGGDTARVAILAAPERVWHHLVMVDSLRAWRDSATTITASSDSVLGVGDTVWQRGSRSTGAGSDRIWWVVERINPPVAIVWRATDDSTGLEIVRRTDSITTAGDSTILLSRFVPTILDSLQARDGGGLSGRLIGGMGKMMVGATRTLAELDQARLKVLLETP